MIKTVLLAFLAVGVLAEVQVTDDQRQQFKDFVKQQCKKVGAEDKADDVETAFKNFLDCGKSLFNGETIKKEIEDAKPIGALDEVFKKYCEKSPQVKTCFHNLFSGVAPCLDESARSHLDSANNATDQLIDFVCFKDGDRIALFIAEGGPECFQEKTNAIRECGEKARDGITSVEEAKSRTLEQHCTKFDEVSACVVKALESCSTPTPANMAESLFKYVRNGSPCPKKA